ncbi:esterase/lipase family protein [Undibacterium sp. Ren11W]|uniref:esterase/lipase family protein n=1 Tax=Undibacterium sp. Ren11W TaxID=3413045 RepID=UPI003BF13620
MECVLIHGMGRTPVSMLVLQHRLRRAGHRVHLLGYLPTLDTLDAVSMRLQRLLATRVQAKPYVLVGHSLGSVIIRYTVAQLSSQRPAACFLLAPPMIACRAAKYFSQFFLFRWLTGEMGKLLAQEAFMQQLPVPENTTIYAGIGGPRVAWLPFGKSLNDGILSLEEACGDGRSSVLEFSCGHTFIMNSRAVCENMLTALNKLEEQKIKSSSV